MNARLARCFLAVSITMSSVLLGAGTNLKSGDVRPMYDEMLGLHVEFKEFSPALAARSIKLFIDQFDPYRLYLLEDEVAPYLQMNEADLEKVVRLYRSGNLSVYRDMASLFQKAVFRAREMRAQVAKQIISSPEHHAGGKLESYTSFSASSQELRDRLRKQLSAVLASERKASAGGAWSGDKIKKLFALWEKKLARLENTYVGSKEEVREHFFAMHVLKSQAKSLDAHTTFFSPEEAYQMRASLEKQFEGVGIVLREGVDGIGISDVVRGGPAEKSGKIFPGDLLIEVNGKLVEALSYDEVLDALKGDRGSKVTLGVRHANAGLPAGVSRVELVREKIVMQDDRVRYSFEKCNDGIIGKIILPSFYESGVNSSCEKDMREALRSLKKEGDLKGVVIDMRDNSGGFLNQAVKLSGLFITSGVVVISKYSRGEMQYLRDVDGRSYFDGPIVLLTSKASASAAEIVAQALQDYGVAVVVGDERTYGKGTIQYQTVTDDQADNFFKVTVGRYYTVSGRSTQIEGVKADIVVPTEYHPYNIGERFLAYPLKNDQVSAVYMDPLVDVDGKNLAWFQKNYLPNIQKKLSVWTQMLPRLRESSSERIRDSKKFARYFYGSDADVSAVGGDVSSDAVKDPQMAEAVSIVKDMIQLQQESFSSAD